MSKTVIEMAREVGAHKVCEFDPLCSIGLMAFETHELERLVELVRADEREACAKVCDDWAKTSYLSEAKSCAKIIRARGSNT